MRYGDNYVWNKLYRRDILEAHAVRMDEAVHFSEDMIFNLQYLVHTETVAVCNESGLDAVEDTERVYVLLREKGKKNR